MTLGQFSWYSSHCYLVLGHLCAMCEAPAPHPALENFVPVLRAGWKVFPALFQELLRTVVARKAVFCLKSELLDSLQCWCSQSYFPPQAFNKYKREGFCLQNVDKAPLAKRRKMKRTSTSTETRSSSSESSRSSSSHSHGKTTPTKTLQPGNPTDSSNPDTLFQFSDWGLWEW